jgi:hypothetical protein
MKQFEPSHDALSALPGDTIKIHGSDNETVKNCIWVPAPKGGKIWTYETESGRLIPYTQVAGVERMPNRVVDENEAILRAAAEIVAEQLKAQGL